MDRVSLMVGWLLACGCIPLEIPSTEPAKDKDIPTDTDDPPIPSEEDDLDEDGYDETIDCDDSNPSVNPGAAELCNGLDDDCSGLEDDDPIDAPTWYADGDKDGYGAEAAEGSCVAPDGFVQEGGDCDDDAEDIHPGALDPWYDGIDSNCDALSDYDQDADGSDSLLYGGEDCNDTDNTVAAVSTSLSTQSDADLLSHCEILSNLFLQENSELLELYLPSLVTVTGEIYIAAPSLQTIWAPELASIGALTIYSARSLSWMELGSLEQVSGQIIFSDLQQLFQLNLVALASVGSDASFNYISSLETLDLASLSSVGGSLIIEGNSVYNVNLPSLESVSEIWFVQNPLWCPPELDWEGISSSVYMEGNGCDANGGGQGVN